MLRRAALVGGNDPGQPPAVSASGAAVRIQTGDAGRLVDGTATGGEHLQTRLYPPAKTLDSAGYRALFAGALRRDLRLLLADSAQLLRVPLFLLLAAVLFQLGEVGAGASRPGPGILWILALIALLSGGDELCRGDREDGSLDQQLLLAEGRLAELALARIMACWLLVAAPLALFAAPLAGLLLQLPAEGLWVLSLSLLAGGPGLAALAAVGSALSPSSRGGMLLQPLLLLPLALPLLIFGVASVEIALQGFDPLPTLAVVLALSLLAVASLPFAIAAAWRIGANV